jgi:hypothetical protein
MQALDFLTRRLWRDEGRALRLFHDRVSADLGLRADTNPNSADDADRVLREFMNLSDRMLALRSDPVTALYEANDYLQAGWSAVTSWMLARLHHLPQRPAR